MKKELQPNEYECASCHNVYEMGWTEEEAKAEAAEAFGKPVEDWKGGALLVCDNCYKKMLPSEHPDAVEYAKKHI